MLQDDLETITVQPGKSGVGAAARLGGPGGPSGEEGVREGFQLEALSAIGPERQVEISQEHGSFRPFQKRAKHVRIDCSKSE